jgi:hypothetical protein
VRQLRHHRITTPGQLEVRPMVAAPGVGVRVGVGSGVLQ